MEICETSVSSRAWFCREYDFMITCSGCATMGTSCEYIIRGQNGQEVKHERLLMRHGEIMCEFSAYFTMLVRLTSSLSRPCKEDRWALPLSTPLSSKQSMVWCPWLCARPSPPGDQWCDVLSFVPASNILSPVTPFLRFFRVLCGDCFSWRSIARSFPLTPACPGQGVRRNSEGWFGTWSRASLRVSFPFDCLFLFVFW